MSLVVDYAASEWTFRFIEKRDFLVRDREMCATHIYGIMCVFWRDLQSEIT